jgi:hypothetical protein
MGKTCITVTAAMCCFAVANPAHALIASKNYVDEKLIQLEKSITANQPKLDTGWVTLSGASGITIDARRINNFVMISIPDFKPTSNLANSYRTVYTLNRSDNTEKLFIPSKTIGTSSIILGSNGYDWAMNLAADGQIKVAATAVDNGRIHMGTSIMYMAD